MSNQAMKSVNIVTVKMVKESSFLYETRRINSPSAAHDLVKEHLEGMDKEYSVVACLNTKNEPTNISAVAVGSLNKAIIHPREVFKIAIL